MRPAECGHVVSSAAVPTCIGPGCFFFTELVDAIRIHCVVLVGGATTDCCVCLQDGKFIDVLAPISTCAITEYFAAQNITLCEGQHAEAGLEACDWITEIGRRLEHGYVLTIDYGHPAADLFDEHHMRGTLLA